MTTAWHDIHHTCTYEIKTFIHRRLWPGRRDFRGQQKWPGTSTSHQTRSMEHATWLYCKLARTKILENRKILKKKLDQNFFRDWAKMLFRDWQKSRSRSRSRFLKVEIEIGIEIEIIKKSRSRSRSRSRSAQSRLFSRSRSRSRFPSLATDRHT